MCEDNFDIYSTNLIPERSPIFFESGTPFLNYAPKPSLQTKKNGKEIGEPKCGLHIKKLASQKLPNFFLAKSKTIGKKIGMNILPTSPLA